MSPLLLPLYSFPFTPNSLIRCYLPKGTYFSKISDKHIAQIESLINNRPMKCPGFKTPIEVASSFVVLQG